MLGVGGRGEGGVSVTQSVRGWAVGHIAGLAFFDYSFDQPRLIATFPSEKCDAVRIQFGYGVYVPN